MQVQELPKSAFEVAELLKNDRMLQYLNSRTNQCIQILENSGLGLHRYDVGFWIESSFYTAKPHLNLPQAYEEFIQMATGEKLYELSDQWSV